jgi:riboflavin kinase/FMN adenylyltransferase
VTIDTFNWNEEPAAFYRGGAVTIGNFDGVHRGHAALLAELRRVAEAVEGPAIAVTFDPHPLQLLRPEQFLPLLTTPADRAELLTTYGADHVLLLRTTPELLRLTAEEFFTEVLVGRLAARAVVEGPNFGFGRNRQGNIDTLGDLCQQHGLTLTVATPLLLNDVPVSSSRVRTALVQGDVRKAAELLSRPYLLRGVVGTGQRRGGTLGFPTANLEQVPTVIPGDGVYAVRALHDGRVWPAAANIGPNPTFGESARKVEVHLIGFKGDLYGRPLAVDFVERLRDTRPFRDVSELVEQLRRDVEQARQLAAV